MTKAHVTLLGIATSVVYLGGVGVWTYIAGIIADESGVEATIVPQAAAAVAGVLVIGGATAIARSRAR